MKALLKTLFGDAYNLAYVAAVVGLGAMMTHAGLGSEAALAMPVTLLIGAGLFARR